MKEFDELKKNLKKDASHLPLIKLAVVGDTATQLLCQAIKGYGQEVSLRFEVFEADYDQIDRQIFTKLSELYQTCPDFVIVFHSWQKLREDFYKLTDDKEKVQFADTHIGKVRDMYNMLRFAHPCRLLYFNFPTAVDDVFGNFANKTRISFTYQARKINYELMSLSQECDALYIIDVNGLASDCGGASAFDSKLYVAADMAFTVDFLPFVAKYTVDIIQSLQGKFKKCLILDLDNTLWGGTIGDDGIESIQIGRLGIGKAFSEIQRWALQLKRRGILLAVCSKNEEKLAKEPFEKHPEMLLRLDDFAVFMANWEGKVENIEYIQSVLGISFDSMVFVDDSPFERDFVRRFIPEITVPDLPEDPAEFVSCLRKLNLFETPSYVESSKQRTAKYQAEAQRLEVRKAFALETDFLSSIDMQCVVKGFEKYDIPRISELTQRSNQFNLRTVRYTEESITEIASNVNYIPLTFSLKDRFGNHGLISVVILKKKECDVFVDTWIMSCRVLKRTVEDFVLNEIVAAAKQNGYERLVGEYIPTAKNGLVRDHYQHLGFKAEQGFWILELGTYTLSKTFVSRVAETAVGCGS